MTENFRKKLYPNYKKRKPKKPKIHPDDVAPEVGHKERIEAEQAVQDADMEEGNYLQDPDEVDTSQPLKSKSFEIDPNKNTPTEREKQREDRLRNRAGSGQQGADIAKNKLPKSKQTDLPQFLQSSGPDYAKDAKENQGFDRDVADAMQESEWRKRVDALIQAGRRSGRIATPEGQLEMLSQAALLGGAALLYFTQTAGQLILLR